MYLSACPPVCPAVCCHIRVGAPLEGSISTIEMDPGGVSGLLAVEAQWKKMLTVSRAFLVTNLENIGLIDYMVSREAMTSVVAQTHNSYQNTLPKYRCVGLFVDWLLRRPPATFQLFLDFLRASDQGYIYAHMKEQLLQALSSASKLPGRRSMAFGGSTAPPPSPVKFYIGTRIDDDDDDDDDSDDEDATTATRRTKSRRSRMRRKSL